MANMTVNQRAQYDRAELSVATTGVQVRSGRALTVYNLIGVAIIGLLGYASVALIDGWARAIVLGFILLTVVGAMIAVSPNRRA